MAIWQKSDPDHPTPSFPTEAPRAAAPAARSETRMETKLVNIGQSVQIKGELSGNEDLTIDGRVDGKILLRDHNLTIGANGRITAEIQAKTVIVVGEVVGNITATDKVEVAPTGQVQGDLRAPRVVLADGSRFKGSIDMERGKQAAAAAAAAQHATASAQPAAEPMPRAAAAMKG
jgi:cytoskeletal protein CcmA (bactofilin family)